MTRSIAARQSAKGRWLTLPLVILLAALPAAACDVAVISGISATDGRPILWKNRDDSNSFFQGLEWYPGEREEIGGHVCLEEIFFPTQTRVCSGGVNEAGFAVLNASVYADTTVEEFVNQDVALMKRALIECMSVTCFEELLARWNDPAESIDVISSNFVAMDAHGGAIMIEAQSGIGEPVRYTVHDAEAAPGGFANHTNFNRYIDNPGVERRRRATALLTVLGQVSALTPLNVMQIVTKDVCDYDRLSPPERFPTNLCISRAQTTASVVIEGVAPGEDPRLTIMWANLGEPSMGVYAPVFPAARQIPEKMKMRRGGASPLNLAIVFKEFGAYDNNGGINGLMPNPLMDTHINRPAMERVRALAAPIEELLSSEVRQAALELQATGELDAAALAAIAEAGADYAFQRYAIDPLPLSNFGPVATAVGASAAAFYFAGRVAYVNSRWLAGVVAEREDVYEALRIAIEVNARYLPQQLPLERAALRRIIAIKLAERRS
ncbi:MAG: hypothetical protein SVU69_11160 [Pseudomonadota bacterium]|nr:hypothetical protein [Pseudomonadota bacterium]